MFIDDGNGTFEKQTDSRRHLQIRQETDKKSKSKAIEW